MWLCVDGVSKEYKVRVTITTSGSRGDVQPFVALGRGLIEAGHEVTLAAPSAFEDFVCSYGLRFVGVDADPRQTTERMLKDGSGLVKFARNARQALGPILSEMLRGYQEACENADVVIYTPVGFFGYTLAVHRGLPRMGAAVQPLFQRTSEFASPFVRPLPGRLAWDGTGKSIRAYNRMTHRVTEQALWQTLRSSVNSVIKDRLGAAPYSVRGPFDLMDKRLEPGLLGWSPSVLPKPRDWGFEREVTGYWFLPSDPTYNPPPGLEEFIEAGPKPISVGFGSMNEAGEMDIGRLKRIVLGALERSGQRAVLLTGWGALSSSELPDNVFAVEEIPHDWLFSRVAAAVHHGGAGTMAASLRAGIPTVPVPFFTDQPFWSSRVEHLGVATKAVNRRQLDVPTLAHAIAQATGDAGIQKRAAELGKVIRSEDGIGRAVDAVHRHVGRQIGKT